MNTPCTECGLEHWPLCGLKIRYTACELGCGAPAALRPWASMYHQGLLFLCQNCADAIKKGLAQWPVREKQPQRMTVETEHGPRLVAIDG